MSLEEPAVLFPASAFSLCLYFLLSRYPYFDLLHLRDLLCPPLSLMFSFLTLLSYFPILPFFFEICLISFYDERTERLDSV